MVKIGFIESAKMLSESIVMPAGRARPMCEWCNSFMELCNGFVWSHAQLCIVTIFKTIKKTLVMGNLLYLVAVILIIGWAVGFFVFNTGGIIHVLLVIALIAIILRVIRGGKLAWQYCNIIHEQFQFIIKLKTWKKYFLPLH